MLELRNITLTLRRDGRVLLEDFSLTLGPGDKAVLIGEEGNGKSTLLKYICDPASVADYCDGRGEAVSDGPLACLPQRMDEALCPVTLAEFFADTAWYDHFALLDRLGLTAELVTSDRPLGTLSGGEKVKVQLCRLLLREPDVLLLDEPTNDLDIETLQWLEEYLRRVRQPVLFISHDETLIENTANVILHLEQLGGKQRSRLTVSRLPYREYLAFRRNSLDRQGQVARKQREDYHKQMDKWRQIHDRVEHEQRVISRADPSGGRLLKKKMHAVESAGRRLERQKEDFLALPQEELAILTRFDPDIRLPAGKVVTDLRLEELRRGARRLAGEIRLLVRGGETVGITGRNGVGKSTLLDLLWETLRDRRDIRAAWMPQDYSLVLPYERSPTDFLSAGRSREEITRARTCLGSMRFTRPEMTGPIGELSGGQRAKVLFLDMVLRRANVLLLDEPTRNFSPLSAPVVRAALRDFGGTIISVSHDRKYLQEVCDTLYELTPEGLKQLS